MGVTLAGTNIGLDFDPTTGLLHVATELGEHLVVNTATGVITSAPNLAGQGAGIAYSNNFVGAVSTTLYALQGSTDTLAIVNPATGAITTVGAGLGVDTLGTPGFDIASNGSAYAALQVTSLTGENLFTINLTTGAATLVGAIGVSSGTDIQGLTAACGPSAVSAPSPRRPLGAASCLAGGLPRRSACSASTSTVNSAGIDSSSTGRRSPVAGAR